MSGPSHSKERACHEIQLQNPRGTWFQPHSCRSLHKHARANLARGRSFWSVGARSGSGLTGARERSKSLKRARLPRNPAAKPTRNLVSTALLQVASQACACQLSARAQLLERRRTQRLGSHRSTSAVQVTQKSAPATKSSSKTHAEPGFNRTLAGRFTSMRVPIERAGAAFGASAHTAARVSQEHVSGPSHSKERACQEIQLQNPRGTWFQPHSCRSLHKHARAN